MTPSPPQALGGGDLLVRPMGRELWRRLKTLPTLGPLGGSPMQLFSNYLTMPNRTLKKFSFPKDSYQAALPPPFLSILPTAFTPGGKCGFPEVPFSPSCLLLWISAISSAPFWGPCRTRPFWDRTRSAPAPHSFVEWERGRTSARPVAFLPRGCGERGGSWKGGSNPAIQLVLGWLRREQTRFLPASRKSAVEYGPFSL